MTTDFDAPLRTQTIITDKVYFSVKGPLRTASSNTCMPPTDVLPNYGPGTSKRFRKPVTTGNTVIFKGEKSNFRRSSDLAEAKIYLFAFLVIFDMPSPNHFFRSFCSPVGMTMVLVGVLKCSFSDAWSCCIRRLGPLKSWLDILTNVRKYWEKFQFEIKRLWNKKDKKMPSQDQVSR